jgi:ABC-type polar amino acid transport system ATPase subunit
MKKACGLINVSKSYGDHVVPDKYEHDICESEIVVITGRSGSRKTNILIIMDLLEQYMFICLQCAACSVPTFSERIRNNVKVMKGGGFRTP